jgi:glycosyltransferase involved in cell wall biosynthesis
LRGRARLRRLAAAILPRRQSMKPVPAGLEDGLDQAERITEIWRTMTWIQHADVPTDVLVSVILPTHNRATVVPRAIRSVIAQHHPSWELIVVNDGSADETPQVLAAIEDERVRSIHIDQSGVAGARNRGLSEARGSVIAYLDDDNMMDPTWLRSVVWAFSRWPDVDIVYGADLAEDLRPYSDLPHQMPVLVLRPFDRELMARTSTFPDINVLAHRAGLPEARFDERLSGSADSDFGFRLTAQRSMLPLPVIAAFYSTSIDDRLSNLPGFWDEMRLVRERASQASQAD